LEIGPFAALKILEVSALLYVSHAHVCKALKSFSPLIGVIRLTLLTQIFKVLLHVSLFLNVFLAGERDRCERRAYGPWGIGCLLSKVDHLGGLRVLGGRNGSVLQTLSSISSTFRLLVAHGHCLLVIGIASKSFFLIKRVHIMMLKKLEPICHSLNLSE